MTQTTLSEKKAFCIAETQRFYEIGIKYFCEKRGMDRSKFPRLKTNFFYTGSSAGFASGKLSDNWVSYNVALMKLEDGWEHISTKTIAHEVAHRLDCLVHDGYRSENGRRKIHDQVWKNIMERILGVRAKRCHSIDVSQARGKGRQKRIVVTADCGCTFQLSTTIVNKMKRGQKRWCGKHKVGFSLPSGI